MYYCVYNIYGYDTSDNNNTKKAKGKKSYNGAKFLYFTII